MPLPSGLRLGPYELLSPIGSGGMGEVYRAKDTRLGREVAIKVLPSNFADDPDRRARFEREAQAVAALSHPNIVAIHDTGVHPASGTSPAQAFVVMELLAGQTLRERLQTGALPARKAIEIAVQIARGLGAAHDKGLVHRDLKPENVFLLADGQVKILDFGLARQAGIATPSGASETIAATDPGIVMGTIGYMAPEQVRGQAVDSRADVFAFGVLLYEMLSGARAFHRETAADTMTAILTQDPPELGGSRPDLPPALDRIIRHCLEKNANERFQSARDIAFALEALSGSSSSGVTSGPTAALPARPARRAVSLVVAAALVILAAVAGIMGAGLIGTTPSTSLRFTMKTYEQQSIFNARFMPDGETIVFSSAPSGASPRLFEIRPGTLEARPFGPPGTHLLAVSSKGELAVLTNAIYMNHRLFHGTLARMALEGAPRPWFDDVREADWSPDGTTLAVIRDVEGRDRLEFPAGTKLYEATGYLSDPRVSPDGTRVAFMEHPQRFDDRGYVKVVDRSGKVTTLAGEFWGEEGVAWTPDGLEVLFAGSPTSGQGRDAGEMSYQIYRVTADGRSEARFAHTSPGDFTIHDVSRTGRWLATREDGRYGVIARGAGQTEEQDLTWLNKSWSPALSSDGQRLIFSDGNGGSDYAVVWRKIDGSPIVRLGDGDSRGFSPDGRWALALIASSYRLVAYPLGAGDPQPIPVMPVTHIESAAWAADSKSVILFGSEPGKPVRHYRVTLSGGTPVPILADLVDMAILSPDGKTALGVNRDDTWAIYPLDGGPGRPLAGVGEDRPFAFSDDGRSVFIQRGVGIPAPVDRIDIATGKRTFFREFAPTDRSGLVRLYLGGPVMKADGSQYAYGYVRRPSVLFTVDSAGR